MERTMSVDYAVVSGSNFTAQLNDTLVGISWRLKAVLENWQPYTISLFLSCFYAIFVFPVGFFGNTLILVVNLNHRSRLTASDLYFVNLAVADLILVADSLIEVFNLKRGYYDTLALCTLMALFQQVNMYSSIFFLTWMSYDRCVALTNSIGRRVSHARRNCCLIWVWSCVLTLLPFAVAQAQHAGELNFCFANMTQIRWLEVIVGFLLPFCILGLCYWKIAQVLVRSQREHTVQQRPRRQKALRLISAAVLVFFLCWLPENMFVSVHLVRGDAEGSTLWEDYPLTGHAVRLAAFSNSCLNPLIYSFLGETFRKKLKLFLQRKVRRNRLYKTASAKCTYLAVAKTCISMHHLKSQLSPHLCASAFSHKLSSSSQNNDHLHAGSHTVNKLLLYECKRLKPTATHYEKHLSGDSYWNCEEEV
ncbi:G-protein coupled estrogen receptor 1-like [Thalassophryne amazonica]|uniref:G-protein coupled estrogen receptor 1-like n=1 Tax=Thalassophryne amazonica TaxID=390379 RepID=UPI00147268A5|nr:G-protein coupled estrogen receptor 1-like [Thalassophryne amazonica]